MKKKALLSSIITVMLCLSIIAGSTFALFTSTTDVNIAITSGEVDVVAAIENFKLYSVVPVRDGSAGEVTDENGMPYNYQEQSVTFLNSGTATVDASLIELDRITPGDKIEFNVGVDNGSNVKIAHRFNVTCLEGYGLMSGLNVTINGTTYTGLESFVSGWSALNENASIADDYIEIVIELPVEAGNEFQNLSTLINVTVEAVQANANIEIGGAPAIDLIEKVDSAADLEAALAAGGAVVLGKDINVGATPIEISAGVKASLDLLGHTITSDLVSAGRHAYAIDNYGTLTLTGNGSIMARGIENFGDMTVDGNLTIINLDGNGGAAIWNEGNLEIINGNFLSTVNGGEYGAAVNTRAGGTATIHNGTFATNSDLTYAIINEGGETTVYNATVKGRHGAVYGADVYGGIFVQADGLVGTTDWCAFDCTLYGGTFSSDAPDAGGGLFYTNVTVADGYVAVVNADGSTSIVAE